MSEQINFRQKFIDKAIETADKKWEHLSDWERNFITSIKNFRDKLSQKQYNVLQDIYNRIK